MKKIIKLSVVFAFLLLGVLIISGKSEAASKKVSRAVWSPYAKYDPYCSPKRIDVEGYVESGGLKPTGVMIYRKAKGEKKYKKIATLKKKSSFKYKDKNVTAGDKYYYKVRAYRKVNGKKKYSKYSEVLVRSAVYKEPKYTVEITDRSSESMTIKITSKKNNGITYFDINPYALCDDKDEIEDVIPENPAYIESYSYDGENYIELEEKKEIELKGKETVYLQFSKADENSDLSKGKFLGTIEIYYNAWPCFILFSLDEGTAKAWQNGEMIH
ncbi:MAG: hypothetical protein K5639_02660 [Eubacterium sp.]|nr:hypothetical protein [Eubacterium sp.]